MGKANIGYNNLLTQNSEQAWEWSYSKNEN